VGFVLDQKLDWNTDGRDGGKTPIINNITVLLMVGLVGTTIGSNFSEKMVSKFGLWRTILISNFCSAIGKSLQLILSFPSMILGRLIFGCFVGIQNFCFSKMVNDSIPVRYQQTYGVLLNSGFCAGAAFSNLMGFLIPIDDGKNATL